MPLLQYSIRYNTIANESTTIKSRTEHERCAWVSILIGEIANISNGGSAHKTQLGIGAEYGNTIFPSAYTSVYNIVLLLINNADSADTLHQSNVLGKVSIVDNKTTQVS